MPPKWPKMLKKIMKSHPMKIPKYDMPIRLRPWFVVFTVGVMVTLSLLGVTGVHRIFPVDRKVLHFICFSLSTAVFYFIFDVEEDARRIWFWNHASLIFTGFVCFFAGGFLSEVVRAALPNKQFDFGDVLANWLGASIGLYISYHAEKYYRKRREIARLYAPLADDVLEDEDEDDTDTPVLPSYANPSTSNKPISKPARSTNIWDSREELFGIGNDDDDDEPTSSRTPRPGHGEPSFK
ncbi:hypothetical protein CYLTODRAFT_2605 [Cylindrobasidium torrendii FP15055 ss-10]|uniref:VanZ-like domain-containing protein n=1 Tax=Cylindrobasidium torrendii FP15055 ss-10 TaxID=1314674 RepID=A0A0D7BVX6_9AGAR|nr:hypothetical protein CYLTODRAFT_2605 [Cylindrobasidium torrendii FP15055 ss-10]